jgi:hypothetical protein
VSTAGGTSAEGCGRLEVQVAASRAQLDTRTGMRNFDRWRACHAEKPRDRRCS